MLLFYLISLVLVAASLLYVMFVDYKTSDGIVTVGDILHTIVCIIFGLIPLFNLAIVYCVAKSIYDKHKNDIVYRF
jgi:hypothetical protein